MNNRGRMNTFFYIQHILLVSDCLDFVLLYTVDIYMSEPTLNTEEYK